MERNHELNTSMALSAIIAAPETTSGDDGEAQEGIFDVQDAESHLDSELSELLEQVDVLTKHPAVPTIIVSQDPCPGSRKTLHDQETSSDEEVASDLDASSASKDAHHMQKEIVQLQERLVEEISASEVLKQQLRNAKEMAEKYAAKFEALKKERNDLPRSYKMKSHTAEDSNIEEENDNHQFNDDVTSEMHHNSKLLFNLEMGSDINATSAKTSYDSTKKGLQEKLSTQKQLCEEVERLQKECASLRLQADEHQQMCKEALKTLQLVRTNHINKSRVLQDCRMAYKVQDPSMTQRENPEGQSVEDKDCSTYKPLITSDGVKENTEHYEDVPFTDIERLLEALSSTQNKANECQREAESLRQELQQSRQKSAERAKRINELQSELLETRDLNLNARIELQHKEKQLSEIVVERTLLKEASLKLKQDCKDLSFKNSSLTNELSNISKRVHKYKDKLSAARKELNLLRIGYESQSSLLASLPALHAKLESGEMELRKLTDKLREKEEHERDTEAMLEQERKKLEGERLAWKRSIESRLTSTSPNEEASCSLSSSEEDVPLIVAPVHDFGDGSEKVKQTRPLGVNPESAKILYRSHGRKREIKSDPSQLWIDTSTSDGCLSGHFPRMTENDTRPLLSSTKRGQQRPSRPVSSVSCIEWTRSLTSKNTTQRGDISQRIRPRILLWGNKTEPAKTLIAVSDRALIRVSHCKDSESKTDRVAFGTIRFLGPVQGIEDEFCIGVELDLPVGDHDGKWKSVRYFRCPPQHGVWAKLADIVKIIGSPEVLTVP